MVATKEKRNYPRSKNPRLPEWKLSKRERDHPTNPNKSWKPCKWKLTFDVPQPSTTFQEASKEDSRLAGWQLGNKRPAELFPLMYDERGDPVRCVECGMKWKTGKAPGKGHNDKAFVLDSEGNKVPICIIARQNEEKAQQEGNSAKRPKLNAAQSAAKQPRQPSNVAPASEPASVPALQQSQANLVGFRQPVNVPVKVPLPCDDDNRSSASDTKSSASGTTNVIMENNMSGCDFEEALRNCETRTDQPPDQPTGQPTGQPTEPGLGLDELSEDEHVNILLAILNGDFD